MEKPLLGDEQRGRSCGVLGCLGAVWRWLRGADRRSTEHAETIQMLSDAMAVMDLSMKSTEENRRRKMREAAALVSTGDRENARKCLQTAKQYKVKYDVLFSFRENTERLKADLIFQKQQHAVFNSFSRANDAMEAMLQKMNVDKVMDTLDTIRENLEQGREISEILGKPVSDPADSYDVAELDRELEELVAADRIQTLMDTNVPEKQKNRNSNAEKKPEKKKAVMI